MTTTLELLAKRDRERHPGSVPSALTNARVLVAHLESLPSDQRGAPPGWLPSDWLRFRTTLALLAGLTVVAQVSSGLSAMGKSR